MHVVVQPSLPKAKSGKLQSYSSLQIYGFQISLYKVVCFCLTIYITRVMFLYKLAFQVSCRPSGNLAIHVEGKVMIIIGSLFGKSSRNSIAFL